MITINDNLVKAISWTLVHSVWQGFLLAILAGIVIVFTNKSTAALRYNLFSGLFFIFLMVVAITFNYEFRSGTEEVITRFNMPIQNFHFDIANESNVPMPLSDYIISYLNTHANVIVLLWLLVFSVKCFNIFGSLNHIYRIRNFRNQVPSEYWTIRIKSLCEMLRISTPVILLESSLVKVPSVTGFFKPIILIPIGLLSNLPHDQMEAILLHELAHIRRKDYFVNLMQCLSETLFFFNPGLLWLSSLMKEERENCCDDLAIGVMENKGKFVHALVSFEEYNMKTAELALGFGGKKKHLLNRAKRIIYNNNKSLNVIEKTFLSVSLLMIAMVMLACANSETAENILKAQITIANKEAMQADIAAHKEDAFAKLEDIKAAEADAAALIADKQAMRQLDFANKADQNVQAQVCTPTAPQSYPQNYTRNFTTNTTTEKSYTKEETDSKVHIFTGISGEDLPENTNVDYIIKNVISDLIHEKVIQCSTNLSFKLSEKSLVVNGAKLPESVYSKLKNKYLKTTNRYNSISYNYEMATSDNK